MDIGLKARGTIGELDICLRMLVYPITNVWMRIHHIMMYKESGDIYDNPFALACVIWEIFITFMMKISLKNGDGLVVMSAMRYSI